MGFLNFFKPEKRNQQEIVVNPCPVPPEDQGQSMSLSNLLKAQKGNGMNISAFFDAVNIISNAIAKIPFLFKDDLDEELRPSHYLWHLFDNSKLTRFNTMKGVVKDILIHGNGFIYIERDPETYRPKTLHYSPAEQTVMYYNPLNNDMFYLNPTFNNKWDNGDNYLHFYINSNDGYQGVGIPTYAYKTISLALSTEKSTSDFWASGGQLNALISTNGANPQVGTREKQIQSLRQSWDEARSRSQGTGVIFVPADLKFTPLSQNAKDSALIESRLFTVQEVARWFGISPSMLGDYSHSHYNTLAEADREFVMHTLQPYIVMIEEEMQRKLIMPSKQDYEFVDLDENSIISVDKEKQSKYLQTLVTTGIMTVNEARKVLELPQVEGGDKLIIAYTDINQNTINNKDNEQEEENEEQ